MNYFAHGRDFIDDPYFLAGTALPDWLSVVDRRARLRPANLEPHLVADDSPLCSLVQGVLQHQRDDAWFHATRAFAELSNEFCRLLGGILTADAGFRPYFVGHVLVEVLLDASLVERDPGRLNAYYTLLAAVDLDELAVCATQLTSRDVAVLRHFVPAFLRERFLNDYLDDELLLLRMNQVMRRVRLSPLPSDVCQILPRARAMVERRLGELIPDRIAFSSHI